MLQIIMLSTGLCVMGCQSASSESEHIINLEFPLIFTYERSMEKDVKINFQPLDALSTPTRVLFQIIAKYAANEQQNKEYEIARKRIFAQENINV